MGRKEGIIEEETEGERKEGRDSIPGQKGRKEGGREERRGKGIFRKEGRMCEGYILYIYIS